MDKAPKKNTTEILEQRVSDDEKRKKELRDKQFEKIEKQLKKVTSELFARFLDEKAASGVCLSCGSDRLSVPETSMLSKKLPDNFPQLSIEEQEDAIDDAMMHYLSYSFIEDESMPRLGNVKYHVSCLNCGFISFYRALPVVKWVLDQEEGKPDE